MSETMFPTGDAGAEGGDAAPVNGADPGGQAPNPGGEGGGEPGGEPTTYADLDDFVGKFAGGRFKDPAAIEEGYKEIQRRATDAEAARKAIEAKLGGHKGAPVDENGEPVPYEFEFPEYVGEKDELLIARANEIGRKHNASQEMMQELLTEVYGPSLAAVGVRNQAVERAGLEETYGSEAAASEVLSAAAGWLRQTLPEDMAEDIDAMGSFASGVRVAHALMKAFQSVKLPEGGMAQGLTWDAVSKAMSERPGHPDTEAMLRRYSEMQAASQQR